MRVITCILFSFSFKSSVNQIFNDKCSIWMNRTFTEIFFTTALCRCLLLKASNSVTIFPWSFSGKIQTFFVLVTAPQPPTPLRIPFSEIHSFKWKPLFLFVSMCLKINKSQLVNIFPHFLRIKFIKVTIFY